VLPESQPYEALFQDHAHEVLDLVGPFWKEEGKSEVPAWKDLDDRYKTSSQWQPFLHLVHRIFNDPFGDRAVGSAQVRAHQEAYQKLIVQLEELEASYEEQKAELLRAAEHASDQLERARKKRVHRMTDAEMEGWTTIARSQQRMKEDKETQENEIEVTVTEAAAKDKHKLLSSCLVDLSALKKISRALTRLNNDRLNSDLAKVSGGPELRAKVKGLLVCGVSPEDVVHRLTEVPLGLDLWVREAVVVYCLAEMELDRATAAVRELRAGAVPDQDGNSEVPLHKKSCQTRVEMLRERIMPSSHQMSVKRFMEETGTQLPAAVVAAGRGDHSKEVGWLTQQNHRIAAIYDAEQEVAKCSTYLREWREKVTARIHGDILQAKHTLAPAEAARDTTKNMQVLTLLTSQAYAKLSMKDLSKAEEQGEVVFKNLQTFRLDPGTLRQHTGSMDTYYGNIPTARTAMQSRQCRVRPAREPL